MVDQTRGEGAGSPDAVLPSPAQAVPPKVADMIARRWRGDTLNEIGAAHGVTRERIRQLLNKYGGPTAKQVRDQRAANGLIAEGHRKSEVAAQIRRTLDMRGPMTIAEIVAATGINQEEVAKFWPQELSHLRLHPSGSVEKKWSDDAIVAAIREAALYEFPLTTTAYADLLSQGQIEGPSMPRIWQRFGSWTSACQAAGVVAGHTMRPHYESRWSDDDLLQIARAYLLDTHAPNSVHRFDEWKRSHAPDGPSCQTLRNRFGSWTEVKRRALAHGDVSR